MNSVWLRIAVGGFILAWAAIAQTRAATPPVPQDDHGGALEQGTWAPAPRPLFSVLGVPLSVNTPMAPTYRNSFTDFGGQLANGRQPVAGFRG
jgi:hypothetical protein